MQESETRTRPHAAPCDPLTVGASPSGFQHEGLSAFAARHGHGFLPLATLEALSQLQSMAPLAVAAHATVAQLPCETMGATIRNDQVGRFMLHGVFEISLEIAIVREKRQGKLDEIESTIGTART